jgi:hypothetical protein
MIKLSAISPKTIVSMGGQEGASTPEENQLKDLLSQMAYSMLQSKAPNLMPYITSFKPIELDLDSNKAVGAFSIDLNGKSVMIPIVMSDGKVKPPEVFYAKDQDAFLPLNNKWMEEIQKAESNNLGEAVEAPESLSSDVDIRALTLPPTTGRFVYASFNNIDLPRVIDNCDNLTKVAFAEMLKKSSKILKSYVKYNGASSVELLRPRYNYTAKVASVSKWAVLDPKSSKESYITYFGNKFKDAFSSSLKSGYAVKDFRKTAEILVDSEIPLDSTVMARSGITEPNFPGVYNISKLGGTNEKVYIVPNPFMAGSDLMPVSDSASGMVSTKGDYGPSTKRNFGGRTYLVITPSKSVGYFSKIVAMTTTETIDTSSVIEELMSERDPRNGDKLFLSMRGGDITNAAYFPEGISNVTNSGSGDIYATYMGKKVVFTTSKAIKVPKSVSTSSGYSPFSSEGNTVIIVPISFRPVSVSGSLQESDYITDADQLRTTVTEKISSLASKEVRIKRSSDGSWVFNGSYCDDKTSLLKKMGSANINVEVANSSIAKIPYNSSKLFKSFTPTNLTKLSSIFGPDAQPPQGMPPDQMGGMPPQGMPPDQMGGMPPQGMPPDQMGGMPPQGMPPDQGGMPPDQMGGMPPQGMPGQPGMAPQAQQTMEAASNLNDESIFNASAAASLLQYNPLNEAVAQELPNIEKALDSTARILVSVQMREAELAQQIGQDAYNELEGNLRKVLGGLGDIILSLHKQKSMTSLPEGIS